MAGWLSFLPPPQSIKQPSRPASLDSHISSIQTPSYHTSPQLTTTHIEEKNQRDVQTRRSQLMVEQGRSAAVREATSTTIMKKKQQLTATKPDKDKNCSSSSKKQSSHSCTAELAAESPSYRLALKSLFSCRNSHAAQHQHQHPPESTKKCKKQLGCSASICKLKDSSPRVMHRPAAAEVDATAPAGEPCKRRASVSGACNGSSDRLVKKKPLSEVNPKQHGGNGGSSTSSSSSTTGGSSFRAGKGMQLRRLSGCYECHMVVDPISGVFRDSGSMRGATIFSCPDCAEIFVRAETLHLHQSISHAVSELGPEDTSRNIIEIIFQSSWLKKQSPVCVVDRILKVHNAPGTLARFEDYRDAVKAKATSGLAGRRHPRCTADGNELLRFHCATLACSLGLHGDTHLCDSSSCAACGVIRDGFKMAAPAAGVRTMATSGRAHDAVEGHEVGERRAMLVCRVIAGRVKRAQEPETETETAPAPEEEYDSVAGSAGVYSSLDELEVFNPRAILPCFVVVYKA